MKTLLLAFGLFFLPSLAYSDYHPSSLKILEWKYPDLYHGEDYFLIAAPNGWSLDWLTEVYQKPSEADVLEWHKGYCADYQKGEIETQVRDRSFTITEDIPLTPGILKYIDLFIGTVLISGATEAPASWAQEWQDTAALRNDRNALMNALYGPCAVGGENYCDLSDRSGGVIDTWTGDQICAYDLDAWPGWDVEKP